MPDELYRIQDLCLRKDNTMLIDHLTMYQYKGEIIGLIGLHDSGKTLLSLILSGQELPDSGRFYYEESPVSCQVLASHVALVQRRSSLIPSLSVAENVFIIRRHKRSSFLMHRKMILHEAQNYMREMRLTIPPHMQVKHLTRSQQCLVEILKAYILGARLIILDDIPLTFFQDPQFSRMYQYLKEKKVSFLLTSCDIYQLQLFSDRIYFMDDHRIVKWIYNEKRNAIDISRLYSRPLSYTEPLSHDSPIVAMKADGLCYGSLKHISFELHEGGIVAIFDLFRNASSQLLDLLSHPRNLTAGSINVYEKPVKGESCASFVFAGFELEDCIFETLSTRDNICIGSYKKLAGPLGILRRARMQYVEQTFIKEYEEEGFNPRASCRNLPKKERLAMYLYRLELLRKKIIFCIYPEKYIDYDTLHLLKKSLQRIARRGNTVCIITCDFEKIYPLAERHLILSLDSIQEYAGKDEE